MRGLHSDGVISMDDKMTKVARTYARREPQLGSVPGPGFQARKNVEHNNHDEAITQAVLAAQSGDMDAIRFLYVRYKDNVYGYVLSIVREPHEAEDATQQVFTKLISAIHRYEPRAVPFTAWILRVARNIAIDHLRQRRAIPCDEILEPARPFDDARGEYRRGLEIALETLPEEQRDVIVLRHLVGLSPGEIAERMGRTESSIHGLHHRGRVALRRQLAALDCAPVAKAVA
jgi:RNA polymerase sigma-70 factor, ECF subfamily